MMQSNKAGGVHGVYRLILGIALLFGATQAHAQSFGFLGGFGSLCGPIDRPPQFVETVDGGPLQTLVVSTITTLNADEADGIVDGLGTINHRLVVSLVDINGIEIWKQRNISLTSLPWALSPPPQGFEGIIPGVNFESPFRTFLFYPFAGECLGLGVAEVGGKRYVTVSLGSEAADGDPQAGADLTRLNIAVLNASTGAIVKKHNLTPKPGKYLLAAAESGIFDVDGDGNHELLLAYSIPKSQGRTEFVFQSIGLLSGSVEDAFRTLQTNKLIIQ